MKKFLIAISSFLLILIVLIVVLNQYNSQRHIILSKKFYISINKESDIFYFHDVGGKTAPLCYAALRVNDKEYNRLIDNMNEAGYKKSDFEHTHLEKQSDWVPVDDIKESYLFNTVEYNHVNLFSVQGRRIRICVYITNSVDGYRSMYFYNNCGVKDDGTIISN